MVTIWAPQKQNRGIYMLLWCKMHISPNILCFCGVKCRRADWFTHFTQLRKKPCEDHRGYPFLKDCTFTPENPTSKVGHRVLKNFIFDISRGGCHERCRWWHACQGACTPGCLELSPWKGVKVLIHHTVFCSVLWRCPFKQDKDGP